MTESPAVQEMADVPAQVFESFLEALQGTDVSAEVVARLRKTLLVDQTYTEGALKAAIWGEEQST